MLDLIDDKVEQVLRKTKKIVWGGVTPKSKDVHCRRKQIEGPPPTLRVRGLWSLFTFVGVRVPRGAHLCGLRLRPSLAWATHLPCEVPQPRILDTGTTPDGAELVQLWSKLYLGVLSAEPNQHERRQEETSANGPVAPK